MPPTEEPKAGEEKTMTVGELRKALEGVRDDMEVVVRAYEERDDGDEQIVGGVFSAAMEFGCDNTPAFIIDANSDDAPGDEEE